MRLISRGTLVAQLLVSSIALACVGVDRPGAGPRSGSGGGHDSIDARLRDAGVGPRPAHRHRRRFDGRTPGLEQGQRSRGEVHRRADAKDRPRPGWRQRIFPEDSRRGAGEWTGAATSELRRPRYRPGGASSPRGQRRRYSRRPSCRVGCVDQAGLDRSRRRALRPPRHGPTRSTAIRSTTAPTTTRREPSRFSRSRAS